MAPIPNLRPVAKAVMRTQSDLRLVALVRAGSEDAFAEIVRRYRPGLIRLARALGSGDRSEDVVQDGLVRAWRALRSSEAEIELRPWLTTIVRNRAMSAHAAARDHDELDETIDGVPRPPDVVLMREELRSTVSAVNALPGSQREALVRSALRGESHEQIAGALAITPGAVRQLIFRARSGLRAGLGALIPAPLVRQLAELSTPGGDPAAATAAIAAASAGGGSLVTKGAALVLIGAAVAGSGIALDRTHRNADSGRDPIADTGAAGGGAHVHGRAGGGRAAAGPEAGAEDQLAGADRAGDAPGPANGGESGGSAGGADSSGDTGPGGSPGSGESGSSHGPAASEPELGAEGPGEELGDHSGPGDGSGEDSSGPGSGSSDDSSGPGSGADDGLDSSGHGSGEPETEPVSDSSGPGGPESPEGSGSGSSGSGSSGSGSSGSGSGDALDDPAALDGPLDED